MPDLTVEELAEWLYEVLFDSPESLPKGWQEARRTLCSQHAAHLLPKLREREEGIRRECYQALNKNLLLLSGCNSLVERERREHDAAVQEATESWMQECERLVKKERERLLSLSPCGKHTLAEWVEHVHWDGCLGKQPETEGGGEYLACREAAHCRTCRELKAAFERGVTKRRE